MFNKNALKPKLSDITIYDKVHFVLYSINSTITTNPFMILHLCKCSTGQLIFPVYTNNNITETECSQFVEMLLFDYKKYIDAICYSGYIHNEQLYVFYEIKWNTYEAEYIDTASSIFPVLVDEILNQHSIYNINIHHEVTTFFVNNQDILYLRGDNNLPIEYPIVTYRVDVSKKIPFMAMFGASKDLDGEYGPYFYFKSYKRNIEEAHNLVEKTKYGILRCAIFTGNMTVHSDDFIETNKDTLYIKDSYIIKNLYNHIPLTYHYLNYNI